MRMSQLNVNEHFNAADIRSMYMIICVFTKSAFLLVSDAYGMAPQLMMNEYRYRDGEDEDIIVDI